MLRGPLPAIRRSNARLCTLTALLALALGCDELSEFRTHPGEVFRGRVIGNTADSAQSSFIRRGFVSAALLDLTFDPAFAVPPEESAAETAGTLTTYTCPNDAELCEEDERERGHFRNAELVPIPELSHDVLGRYELPGGSRLRNYLFGARFMSGEGLFATQRHATVFLSLLENGQVEVRILAPSVLGADGRTEAWPGLFGVFSLVRRAAP